jgi:hypothetical protein
MLYCHSSRYVTYNVLALCLACTLYNHMMLWHSEVRSAGISVCVSHLAQKCLKKTVNMNGSWPGWLQQYDNRSERVALESVLTCE